ncbi:hypothetical protein PSEUBRA_001504 [Kalmanozyma brasiliensis GHG001]|uniref:Uncharacterized protein n=1 Tax=Kalmanozyma brasiliensis (strain GHG001) TaxID=1365824 RepID=V5EYH3_KALBG|nr:uncharacterized protein PSEUBRA_001504 [Kalmanozyma brasiliensis GHG001]EST08803.1 hypothetical protein PSEUBRA_001504 [Kalmanozyma brasiliensis GHG001]
MLEVTPPTRIPMFPANYREFLIAPAAPRVPTALQTLQPGEIFQLAQPKWPIAHTQPSFYALALTTIVAAFFLLAFKDVAALINYELRTRLRIPGNPVVGTVLGLLAATMLCITYENDVRKRSGYYPEGADPRQMVWLSGGATVCAILWASSTFQSPIKARDEQTEKKVVEEKVEQRGSRRSLKKQAKREAKKISAKQE